MDLFGILLYWVIQLFLFELVHLCRWKWVLEAAALIEDYAKGPNVGLFAVPFAPPNLRWKVVGRANSRLLKIFVICFATCSWFFFFGIFLGGLVGDSFGTLILVVAKVQITRNQQHIVIIHMESLIGLVVADNVNLISTISTTSRTAKSLEASLAREEIKL